MTLNIALREMIKKFARDDSASFTNHEELKKSILSGEMDDTLFIKERVSFLEQFVQLHVSPLVDAGEALLRRDQQNTCQHETTHRGGSIWEICDICGAKWADDEGGKPEWKDPKEWTDMEAQLKIFRGKNP